MGERCSLIGQFGVDLDGGEVGLMDLTGPALLFSTHYPFPI